MSGRPQQAATGLPARPLLAALVVLALQRHHTSSLAPQREFATTHDDDHSEYRVCSTCKDWLVAGKVTAMSVTYDYRRYQPKPDHLPELNSVSIKFISLPYTATNKIVVLCIYCTTPVFVTSLHDDRVGKMYGGFTVYQIAYRASPTSWIWRDFCVCGLYGILCV